MPVCVTMLGTNVTVITPNASSRVTVIDKQLVIIVFNYIQQFQARETAPIILNSLDHM